MPQSKEVNQMREDENFAAMPAKGMSGRSGVKGASNGMSGGVGIRFGGNKQMPSGNGFGMDMDGSLSVPEKFKDPKTGEIKVEELLKSYLALEKKLSERAVSGAASGFMPASADEYDIQLKNDLITIDPEINERLFELGFTNEQVQAVYDLAVEKVLPLLQELSADYKADQELAALENEFGGAEQFNTIARQISAWGEKNLNPDIYEALCCSKDGILTMYKMMGGNAEPSLMQEATEQYPADTEETLRALMRDPKYWRKNDPSVVKRVEEGFKRLYK